MGQAAGSMSGGSALKMPNGNIACRFYQTNRCRDQKAAFCSRASGVHKHVCNVVKKDGSVCGARHPGMDHK